MRLPLPGSKRPETAVVKPPSRAEAKWGWVRAVLAPSVLVFLALAAATIGTAMSLRSVQKARLHLETEQTGSRCAAELNREIDTLLDPLEELKSKLCSHQVSSRQDFRRLGEEVRAANPGLRMSLSWAGADGRIKGMAPEIDEMLRPPGRQISAASQWSAVWETARNTGHSLYGAPYTNYDAVDVRCAIPLFDGGAGPPATFLGELLAWISLDGPGDRVFASIRQNYRAELLDGNVTLYSNDNNPRAAVTPYRAEYSIDAGGRRWILRVTATNVFAALRVDRSPLWAAYGGIIVSLLVSGLVFQSLTGRSRQHRQSRRHMIALEKLTEIATAISGRLEFPREVLDKLATAARELLQMELSGISLFEPASGSLNLVAFAGNMPPAPPTRYALTDLPMCRRVLETRKPLFIENVSDDPSAMNGDVMRIFRVTSLIIIPLHVGERTLGLMTLSSSVQRPFSGSERRLVTLLGSKAAVILSNSELYTRMAEALRAQRRLFEQRESIFAVNAAVYQALSFRESLQMIADLAPGVLGVDVCLVTLDVEDEDRVLVAAVTQPYASDLVGKRIIRTGTNGAVVRATRRLMVVEDGRSHPGVHPVFKETLGVGSVAYLPLLRTDGEFMGTLVLIRHQPGPFTAEQLNLAELFTARAAAAAENARLLEQTRRDADAKAMLLRELNHRVKNNLTSIITLLSLDEPELAPAARQWLNRAIDRIRTMARAHDLFSGGMDRVPLAELIEQTIPSLSVVKPSAVSIVADVNGVEATLRTDRAVSVAMVLHELCYNAIVHGMGGSGTVTIRARTHPATKADDKAGRRVAIEVIDEGRPAARVSRELVLSGALLTDADALPPASAVAPPETAASRASRIGRTGLGLILVKGLVTNELRGTFSLSRSEDGGSIARVEFPVTGDEAGGLDL